MPQRKRYDDLNDDPEFKRFKERVRRELIPKIADSFATISIVPSGETDIKFAIELGLSIMLGKPLILAVFPGVQVPDKLALIADEIVEIDPDDTRASWGGSSAQRMAEAVKRVSDTLGLDTVE